MKKFITFLMFSFFLKLSFAAITITPATIDAGYCENPYSFRCIAAGGTAPYSYTISVGSLPTGLQINRTSGVISGIIHLTRDTTISFTVRAVDKLNASGTRAYSMVITNKVVTWQQIVPYWASMPNTYPTYAQVYDTWRLYALGASTAWTQGGNTVSTIKKFGTIDSLDVPFISKNIERARIYSNGNGFNVTNAYYLASSKLIYFPAGATGNLSIGAGAGNASTQSTSNTNIGSLSLTANTTADFVTAIGANALRQNTTGANGTAIGYNSLTLNTTGGNNTAVGFRTMSANTTGGNNTSIGYQAMRDNLTGNLNVAIGSNALLLGTTIEENTAIGYTSMQSATTAYYNIGLGNQSLIGLTTGNSNVALGRNAMQNLTTGFENTGVGNAVFQGLTTGVYNTAIGLNSGKTITTGSNNTVIGWQMANTGSLTTGSNNTLIGSNYQPGSNFSNNIVIADGAGVARLQYDATGALTLTGPAVTAKVAEPSTHVVTINIGGTVLYLLATNVAP